MDLTQLNILDKPSEHGERHMHARKTVFMFPDPVVISHKKVSRFRKVTFTALNINLLAIML